MKIADLVLFSLFMSNNIMTMILYMTLIMVIPGKGVEHDSNKLKAFVCLFWVYRNTNTM